MKIKSLLAKLFGKAEKHPQTINVVRYPDKILFETIHQIKNSYWIRGEEITILDALATNDEIGETILRHLNLSRYGIKSPDKEVSKALNEQYKKATGLKTLKKQMENSLMITISRENYKINFMPTINGGSSGENRGYRYFKEGIEIDDTPDTAIIGTAFRKALNQCK